MWLETFKAIQQDRCTLVSMFLQGAIRLSHEGSRLSSTLVERASAVLAARIAVKLKPTERRRLVFLLPQATQSLGRYLAVSVLLADFVHRDGTKVPAGEKGTLIHGDLLLVTQHIRECVTLLREVSLGSGSSAMKLADYWSIDVVSQHPGPSDGRARVSVANPGWFSAIGADHTFGLVVIDVSHPRTGQCLDQLLEHPSIAAAPVQILVTPPREQTRIDTFRENGRHSCLVWAWDPGAVMAVEHAVSPNPGSISGRMPERCMWLCDDDDVDERLAELHRLLNGSVRLARGRAPARLMQAWSVYHRLRQLAVPLIRLEEQGEQGYRFLTLKDRIALLDQEPAEATGELGSYLDARWPRVVELLREVYQILMQQREPAKFYALAAAVDEHLKGRASPSLRIVTPTQHEGSMLAALLGELVDGWGSALQSGRVSIVTSREEPRLIAEGECQDTMLLGFRTSETRYLDVYPGMPVHIAVHPYEAEIDDAIQRRVHASVEQLQEDELRTDVLRTLRLPVRSVFAPSPGNPNGPHDNWLPRSQRARTTRRFERRQGSDGVRRFLDEEAVEPLSVGQLAGMSWLDEMVVDTPEENRTSSDGRQTSVEFVEIVDTLGQRLRYPASKTVDVFHARTELKERLAAAELQPGMLLVSLVDDPYEDLFQRLLEAIREQRGLQASLTLDLWRHAKQAALIAHRGNRRSLYAALAQAGLSVDYAAVVGWYTAGEGEVIAPLVEADFERLARQSGVLTDRELIRATFAVIRNERNMRRQCGKVLCQLLTQIAAGKHYEAALTSARALGTPVERLAAAVTLREIASVQRIGTLATL